MNDAGISSRINIQMVDKFRIQVPGSEGSLSWEVSFPDSGNSTKGLMWDKYRGFLVDNYLRW